MLEPEKVQLSPMQKTWILDLDGTIVVHDGPYILGKDQFLPGAEEFLASIPPNDIIIFLEPGRASESLSMIISRMDL